jgi:hypothetical protein
MPACKKYVSFIDPFENIGDSLIKINNNFYNLKEVLLRIKANFESIVRVRTFFYYGMNSDIDATNGMQNNSVSRPSNIRIEDFCNSSSQLNLPRDSKRGDIAYVIYQKTGYLSQEATRITTGTINVCGSYGGQTQCRNVGWRTTSPDYFTTYSPAFVIWKLLFNGTKYTVDVGFPKYSQAETISTPNWMNPRAWSTY